MKGNTKYLKISLAAGLFIVSLSALAAGIPSSSTNRLAEETGKSIRHYFKFPQVLYTQHELKEELQNKVEVLFTVDNNGKVNFVWAKTTDRKLKTQIERTFSTLCFNNLKHKAVHNTVLKFKTR